MIENLIIKIGDRSWKISCTTNQAENELGLSNVEGLVPGTGMLFVTCGYVPDITTENMLFPIDIIFFNRKLNITEILRNVEPGFIVKSCYDFDFFLEINASESKNTKPSDHVIISYNNEVEE
jgi:uncharacterized membrane protein (UPF0127 family)